jgi:hypothetical protein
MQGELRIEKNSIRGTGIYFSVPVREVSNKVSTSNSSECNKLRQRMII